MRFTYLHSMKRSARTANFKRFFLTTMFSDLETVVTWLHFIKLFLYKCIYIYIILKLVLGSMKKVFKYIYFCY